MPNSESVLLRFLSNGLIDVGGDDAKLEKLQATADELASILKKSPKKAAAYSLVAIDEDAPADDPVVQEVLGVLRGKWTTYANTFSGTPVLLVRAMLLDSLQKASFTDERIGVVLVNTARNTLSFMEVGSEREIWIDLVAEMESLVEARAEAEWATPSSITVPQLVFELPEFAAPKVKFAPAGRAFMKKSFMAAVGPHYQDPQQGAVATGGNPHTPGSPPQWTSEFGDRMSVAVADVIDAVLSKISVEQVDVDAPFKSIVQSVTDHVDATLRAVSGATAGLQRRTGLIWWKEALFSQSARQSYRELPPAVAAAQMAFDLHKQVPTFSPASVSAFLFEAVVSLPLSDSSKKFAISDLIKDAQTYVSLGSLRTQCREAIESPGGRGPVLALIAYPEIQALSESDEFQRLTGIPRDAQLTLPEWAKWIFRELQATRASVEMAAQITAAEKPARRLKKA